jgi:isocitrate dehydrogenase kinase/phosphatase
VSTHEPATDYAMRIASAESEAARIELAGAWIGAAYEQTYAEFQRLTWLAKSAFEACDHPGAVACAKARLGIYNSTVYPLAEALRAAFPALAEHESLWEKVEAAFVPGRDGRYDMDVALAYIHSARRCLYQGEWKPVEYAFGAQRSAAAVAQDVYQGFECAWPVDPRKVQGMLGVAELAVPYRDLEGDALRVSRRLNEVLADRAGAGLTAIEMIRGGFFRNRGAYLVGRLVLKGRACRPFVIALLNEPTGLYVAAVLHAVPHVHNLFSSTEASFQVTNPNYHELCDFLHTIMPRRPLGLHYSTIGFHHVSKVAVMDEVRAQLARDGEALDIAPGFPGTVAIAFTSPHSDYVLKVIRDRPTDGYKWDSFQGVEAVLDKYKRVHEINRTGSMLDNILYYNLQLAHSWFRPQLIAELVTAASNAARVQDGAVVFRYLVVQRKLTPLNLYLAAVPQPKAARAMANLGYCIRNNAAANVFNRDFDVRNYGVNRYLKVYLYDYDAVEPLTDIKVRTNSDRCDGEEDVPTWFFENGLVFLPEEIETGLRVANRLLRRAFRAAHAELLTVEYWETLQRALRAGQVPGIHTFPESCQLVDPGVETVANE